MALSTSTKMSRRQVLALLAVTVLLLTNVLTIIFYNRTISSLKEQSSFTPISPDANAESLKQCLDRAGIDYKIEDDKIRIREVEQNDAISHCS